MKIVIRCMVLFGISILLLYLTMFHSFQNPDHHKVFQLQNQNIHQNTSLETPLFILYNRIPKCGSTTLLKLIKRLSVKNQFDFIASKIYNKEKLLNGAFDEFKDWIQQRLSSGNFTFFNRHLFYIDMPQFKDNIVYINLMRDPVQRFISGYYYLRKVEKKLEERRKNTKGWNVWLNKSLYDCVRNLSDSECSDFSQTRLTSWGGTFSRRFPTGLGYLCGYEDFCQDANSSLSGDQAIHNIDNKFGVVGVAEDYEMTLGVMEHTLPRFFKGALEEFRKMKREGHGVENKVEHDKTDAETIQMLEERMVEEMRVYKYVKEKLRNKCNEISSCRNVGIKH